MAHGTFLTVNTNLLNHRQQGVYQVRIGHCQSAHPRVEACCVGVSFALLATTPICTQQLIDNVVIDGYDRDINSNGLEFELSKTH
ncbi:hypothetical protein GCM10008090_03050 [Arenicella chitinivorans]|uniref:Uncharacterized protein n=1 Tax=Arenicella chitinivorans TaxID=1329800 RepID=A0A918RGL1_9GAMM|nr:hypothetical protein GCM10008090_03050 [Arenicella chitinivorans]